MQHDYLEDRAANFRLIQLIRTWWARRGYVVKVWMEKSHDPTKGTPIWVIRTNITQNTNNINQGYVV